MYLCYETITRLGINVDNDRNQFTTVRLQSPMEGTPTMILCVETAPVTTQVA